MSEIQGQQQAARTAATPPVDEIVGRARKALTAGRLAEAEGMLRRLLVPEADGAVWKAFGDVLARQGRPADARRAYETALSRGAPAAAVQNNLGNLYEAEGDLAAAEQHYREALALRPELAEASSNLGVLLARRGDLPAAERRFREALAADPRLTNARRNLANTLINQDRPEEAVAVLGEGLALCPDDIGLRVQLGEIHRAAGRLDEAAALYREAVARNPGDAAAQMGLGRTLLDRADSESAIQHCRQAVEIEPRSAEAHHLLGLALFRHGAIADALIHLRRALDLEPGAAVAHLHLGNALEWQGDLDGAAEEHRKAIELDPGFVSAYNNLGNIRLKQHRPEEATAAFKKAIELDPKSAVAHNNLGVALQERERYDEARASLDTALALDNRLAEVHGNLGGIALIHGDVEKAKAHYLQSLALKPDAAFAIYGLSQLDSLGQPEKMIELIASLVEDPRVNDENKSRLYFALVRHYDQAGEFEKAFRAAEAGNAIEHRRRAFDAAAHTRFADRVIATFDKAFFEQRRFYGSTSELPVFIVGMPRSGSTLVEQILASHPQVFGGGELSYIAGLTAQLPKITRSRLPYPEGAVELDEPQTLRLAGHYLRRLRLLGGRTGRVTDKMLFNIFRLGFISLLFPKAKIIYCRRDPRDVFLSGYFLRFSRQLAYTFEQTAFAEYHAICARLMGHWAGVLRAPMLRIDYEDLVAHQEEVSRRLIGFCGLEWDPACLEFHRNERPVRTGSSLQVRRPIYSTSVGRWRDYERFLAPLKAALAGPGGTGAQGADPGASR